MWSVSWRIWIVKGLCLVRAEVIVQWTDDVINREKFSMHQWIVWTRARIQDC